jgi:reverse gyrase
MKVSEIFESDTRVHCQECGELKDCNADDVCESCVEAMREHGVHEAWAEEAKVKHTGRNTNKSVAELKHERAKAKKRGDTKAVKQKNFAIRAKTGWGKA